MNGVIGKSQLFDRELGGYIHEQRQGRKLTLEGLMGGAGLNVSKTTVSKIERGKQKISAYQLFLITKFLGIDTKSLFELVEKKVEAQLEGANQSGELTNNLSEIVNKY